MFKVWQHRRNIVEKLKDPSDELTFTQNILKRDSKNYHAWQYRQWAIKHFSLWSRAEFDYVEHLVDQDVRNNSAWNQRYFCLANKLSSDDSTTIRATLDREVDYTLNKIATCVDNESAWNYLRALVSRFADLGDETISVYPQNVVDFCMGKLNSGKEDESSPFLLAFVVDYNYYLCKNALKNEKDLSEEKKNEIGKLVKSSIELLESLANRLDTIRVNYWNFLIAKWKQEFKFFI